MKYDYMSDIRCWREENPWADHFDLRPETSTHKHTGLWEIVLYAEKFLVTGLRSWCYCIYGVMLINPLSLLLFWGQRLLWTLRSSWTLFIKQFEGFSDWCDHFCNAVYTHIVYLLVAEDLPDEYKNIT